jgi:transposase
MLTTMHVLGVYDMKQQFEAALLRHEHHIVLGLGSKADRFEVLMKEGKFEFAKFPSTSSGFNWLVEWLQERHIKELHVCLEMKHSYERQLAEVLSAHGYLVSIVDSELANAFSVKELKQNKREKIASKVIAYFGASQLHAPWSPSSSAWQELETAKRYLRLLQGTRDYNKNVLEKSVSSDVVSQMAKAHLALLDEQIKELQEHINPLEELLKRDGP